MPKRFNLTYINEEGKEEQPVVVHRSSIGAIERLIAFLIEKYRGAFPVWLAPVQVVLIPIAERHNTIAQEVLKKLIDSGIRAEVDDRNESMQAKIRTCTLQKVPYMAIIGDKEIESGSLAIRTREGKNAGVVTIESFLDTINEEIHTQR